MSPDDRKSDAKGQPSDRLELVPPGAPRWITPALIRETIRVWQPYYEAMLTPDEALTILLNVGRLFEALLLTDELPPPASFRG